MFINNRKKDSNIKKKMTEISSQPFCGPHPYYIYWVDDYTSGAVKKVEKKNVIILSPAVNILSRRRNEKKKKDEDGR